jgi:lipoic acid synthetase
VSISSERFDSTPRVRPRANKLPANPEEAKQDKAVGPGRFPSWLHRKLPKGGNLWKTSRVIGEKRLHTVCEEARCPNLTECWSKKTATFLVLGKECTRACGFCDIDFSKAPAAPDAEEPIKIARSVEELGLEHVVITMVARDDLSDGGAEHLAEILRTVRAHKPGTTLEVLTSDFHGNRSALDTVLAEKPEVFNYNLETVRRLTPRVRHTATYERTLDVLKHAASQRSEGFVKSGLMVGLGESDEEVQEAIRDLKEVGVDIITIGQYLQPNRKKLLVKSFVTPEQFAGYEAFGHEIGVPHMYCGPFVRSSYNADLFSKKLS